MIGRGLFHVPAATVAAMATRVLRRRRTVHQLVAVSNGLITTRCGLELSKPKRGYGAATCWSSDQNCDDCDRATEELLATVIAST